jgi:hypothetical protein
MGKRDINKLNHEGDRKKGTFIVKIEYCQNESWQGQVVWAEENRSERFRSTLELIKLIDEAMSSGQQISFERKDSVS